MNKFTFRSLKTLLFGIFVAMVCILLGILFLGPAYRMTADSDEEVSIPAAVYLSDSDVSGSDISETDLSFTDISAEVTE